MENSEIVSALVDLEKHPGWAIVRDLYEQGVKEVVDQVLDQALEDELTLKLKHAHGMLVEARPENLRQKTITKHRTLAQKEATAALAQAATDGTPAAT